MIVMKSARLVLVTPDWFSKLFHQGAGCQTFETAGVPGRFRERISPEFA
jgi:hypothetical protein